MTQEGQGPRPDETPPPVTTRWSEEPAANDDELAPPFVPGRAAGARPEHTPTAPDESSPAEPDPWAADADPVAPDAAEISAHEETAAAPDSGDAEQGGEGEPFPFDSPWDSAPESDEAEEADFPFDQIDHDPEAEDHSDIEADRGDFLPGEGGPGTTPEDAVGAEPGPDGWEPFGAEPDESGEPPADAEPADEPKPYADTVPYADAEPYPDREPYVSPYADVETAGEVDSEAADSGFSEPWAEDTRGLDHEDEGAEPAAEEDGTEASSPVDEVAGLLNRLADRLREEGAAGLQAEMESDDRLTSLVAGLLAGYVSGRT